jgi:nucleotide-binding universal stress UspA family protein
MITCSYIITGIDLGPDTDRNISYAAYFASGTGATVRLLYIIDYLMTPPSYLSSYIEEEKKKEEKEMARLQTLLNGFSVKNEASVIMGRLQESFMQVITETSADLLVIGYRSHLLRPSSSERLIKSLAMPMLVVSGKFAENASPGTVKIRKILCPVDFSSNSLKAISMAKAYAELFSADLQIMHVVPSYRIQEKWEQWFKPLEKDRQSLEEELYLEAAAKLSRTRDEFNIEAEGVISHGTPGEMICSAADEGTYDMVVMGARGLSFFEGILIGSTTESVLRASPCPVLVVH